MPIIRGYHAKCLSFSSIVDGLEFLVQHADQAIGESPHHSDFISNHSLEQIGLLSTYRRDQQLKLKSR